MAAQVCLLEGKITAATMAEQTAAAFTTTNDRLRSNRSFAEMTSTDDGENSSPPSFA